MFKLRISAIFALLVLLGAGLYGCAEEPILFQPDQDVPTDQLPGDGTATLSLQIDGVLAQHNEGASSAFMVTNTVQVIGNIFLTGDRLDTEWKMQNWSSGDVQIQTMNGRWYSVAPSVDGNVQITNFLINDIQPQHFVQLDEMKGIFAQVKLLPDSSGFQLYQLEDNRDQLMTVHYRIYDPAPADFQGLQIVGTSTNWNQMYPEAIYSSDYGIWEWWGPALKASGNKVAFRIRGSGALPTSYLITAQGEVNGTPVGEEVQLDCTELVENVNTYFASTTWFTDRGWLAGKRVYRLIIHEDGGIEQGCGGIPIQTTISITNNRIPQDHHLMCVYDGYNDNQPFEIPRVSGKWETGQITLHSGPAALSVWDTSDGDKPIITTVKIGSQEVKHLEVFQDPGSEPTVHFTFVLGEGPTLQQGTDNRTGTIGGENY